MASELCKACDAGRNCLNGLYCLARKQYVEHQVILECNERLRNKGEEQNVLSGAPGTDPQSHKGVAKEKPGKNTGRIKRSTGVSTTGTTVQRTG